MSTKQNFVAFVQRLQASDSPTSQNLLQSILLTTSACETCANGKNKNIKSLAKAAETIGNAYLSDHRAFNMVQYFVLQSPSDMISHIQLLVQHAVPNDCFTRSLLIYIALKFSGTLTPEQGISQLNMLYEQLESCESVQQRDLGTIQLLLVEYYVMLGKTNEILKCLKKAEELGNDTLVGDKALWIRCQMKHTDTTIDHLKYLSVVFVEEDPEYEKVCDLLLEKLLIEQEKHIKNEKDTMVKKNEMKEIIDSIDKVNKELNTLHDTQCAQELYGSFLNYQHRQEISGKFGNQKAMKSTSASSANAADPDEPTPTTTTTTTTTTRSHTCSTCRKTSTKLKTCARCGNVQYCSTECQMLDWKKGGHKNDCKKTTTTKPPYTMNKNKKEMKNEQTYPYSVEPNNAFKRMRQYIAAALQNERFIQWWSTDLSVPERHHVCELVMEDMPKNQQEETVLFNEFGSNFQNLYPELNIMQVCSFQCQCGQCELHGNVPSVLLQWMYARSLGHVATMESDRRLVQSIYRDFELDEEVLNIFPKSRNETFLQILCGIVGQWQELTAQMPPNLTLRAVGCAMCGKDAGTKDRHQCKQCCATFWCSDLCRTKDEKNGLHKKNCVNELQLPHFLRCNGLDVQIAAANM